MARVYPDREERESEGVWAPEGMGLAYKCWLVIADVLTNCQRTLEADPKRTQFRCILISKMNFMRFSHFIEISVRVSHFVG